MPSGFQSAGLDLDVLIKARSTTKRADIGLKTSGTDDSNRWEKSGGTGDQVLNNTGFRSGGVDLKTLFQDANYGGALGGYATNASPSGGNIGAGPFTAATSVVAGGGTPGYTYAWARQSGDATIAITNGTTASPTWTASGTQGSNKSAVWRCTVTDAALSTTTVDVTVTIYFYNTLSVVLDASTRAGSAIGSGPATSNAATGTPSGGSGGYAYAWQYVSGDALTVTSPSSAASTFSGSATAPATLTGVYRLQVTDNLGNTAYSGNVTVTLTFNTDVLNVTLDKSVVSGDRIGAGFQSTDTVTATPTGGTAPYAYLWERQSGDTSTAALPTNAQGAAFGCSGTPFNIYTSVWRCRVTDNVGAIAYSPNVTAQILFESNA